MYSQFQDVIQGGRPVARTHVAAKAAAAARDPWTGGDPWAAQQQQHAQALAAGQRSWYGRQRDEAPYGYNSLFDPNLAQLHVRRPSGTCGMGEEQCRSTDWMLHWAEKQTEPVNLTELQTEAGRRDVEQISSELWSFLSLCLQGEGQITFGVVETFNGLEARRCINRPVTAQSASHRIPLGNQVRNPPSMNVGDVRPGLERFENSVSDFVMADGSPPDDEKKCNIIMERGLHTTESLF